MIIEGGGETPAKKNGGGFTQGRIKIMTSQTRFNMNAGKMERSLLKAGFSVSDEKTNIRGYRGYPISKDGECVGILSSMNDGTPCIWSLVKTEHHKEKVLIDINKFEILEYDTCRLYTSAAGFIRYGV